MDYLISLKNIIQKYKDKFKPEKDILKGGVLLKTWTRKAMKIADYQFGHGAGQKLFSNGIKTKKNRQNTQIELVDVKTREKLAVLKLETGQMLLTIKGARKFEPFEDTKNIVVFDGEKISGNTLFRPGIIEYDHNILPNACVIILNQDKKNVIGVGQSIVGSNYIRNSKTGRVIKVYERIK
jgi:predicted RNA-binding protein (TIGR00451 family)